MKYSVLIITYNKLSSIEKVTKAACSQQADELILCDDCSSDGTFEWAEKSGYFKTLWKKPQHDQYALNTLRNKGVELCSNSYIVILDGDCVPGPSFFDGHNDVFTHASECISIGFTIPHDSTGEKPVSHDPRLKETNTPVREMWWGECFGGNIALTKNIWQKVGGFDEAFNGHWGFEDLDFAYRAHKLGYKFYSSCKTQVKHLQHPPTVSDHYAGKGRNYQLLISKHGKIM